MYTIYLKNHASEKAAYELRKILFTVGGLQ